MGQDAIFVVVQDNLTKGERTLVDVGDEDTVLGIRAAWQRAMRRAIGRDIKQLTGRRVIGFRSTNPHRARPWREVFILESSEVHGRVDEGETGA